MAFFFFFFLVDFCFWHNLHTIFQGKITFKKSTFSFLYLFSTKNIIYLFIYLGLYFCLLKKGNLPFWSNEIYKSTIIPTAQCNLDDILLGLSSFISLSYTSGCNCIIVLYDSMTRSSLPDGLFRHSIISFYVKRVNYILLQDHFCMSTIVHQLVIW